MLFQDLAPDLEEIITNIEELVSSFNEVVADLFGLSERIDLKVIRQSTGQRAKARTDYIVDMAKADALDSLGKREERNIMERYV